MIADVGDYTGDATSGLLWRDTAGEFHGRGDDPRQHHSRHGRDSMHVDSGDYTGDGNADILWRNDADTVSLWEMNGPNVVA